MGSRVQNFVLLVICAASCAAESPGTTSLKMGMKPMATCGPENGSVDKLLEASRHCERWLSDIQTIVVFCKEGLREYAREGVIRLRNEHGQFAEILHEWRETLTSVSAGEISVAGGWYPSAHAGMVGPTEKFILNLEAAYRLSEITRGNRDAVNGPLDYRRMGKGDAWNEVRAFVIDFWDDHFREDDDLSRITTLLELERAAIASLWQPNWSGFFTRERWLAILRKGGRSMSKDTFNRRTKKGAEFRKNPQSRRGLISLDLNTLPATVQAVVQKE
jgi:hypothetical protein